MRTGRTAVMAIGIFFLVSAARGICEVPEAKPAIAAGAWREALDAPHPRLLGPMDHLEKRQAEFPANYEVIKGNSSLLAAGIVNALEGLDAERKKPFIEQALSDVAGGVTNEHQNTWIRLARVAQTYDFFFDDISENDRNAMIEWLNAHLSAFTADETAFHNSTLSKILCYLQIAYATWGESPKARDFRDHALGKLYEGKVLPVLKRFGAGGGFTECGWYARHSLWHLVEALELARRFEGYDGFAMAGDFYYQRLAYEMLQPYPGLWLYGGERYPCEGDGSLVYGGHNEYPRNMRTVLAAYFAGSELAGYTAAKARPASNSTSKIADFLYLEGQSEPLDINAFPLAHYAEGIGKVYARSDWSGDASWLRFECGDYFVGHQHFEVGNFEIFRYEPLATESGEYIDYGSNHSVNWLLRTVAHNSMLVYMPGETWTQLRDGGRNAYANDGGQTKKWEWTVGSLEDWDAKAETFERGDIIAYENRDEYMFVAGDCTAAYKPEKLESWVRQIVFLRPHTFVVFDRVVSARPEYAKTWLLHVRNEPEISGDTLTASDGKGTLVCRTLLPEDAAIKSVHGYTYGGGTFDENENHQSAVAAKWRVEVAPGAPRKEDVFVTVLFTDEPAPANAVVEGDRTIVTVGNATIAFDGRAGGTLSSPAGEFRLEPTVKKGRWQ